MTAWIDWLTASQEYFRNLGWIGVAAWAALIVLVQLLLAPLAPVAISGGFLFGLSRGLVAVTIGTAAGAAINFLISRHIARDAIAHRLARNVKFQLIDRAIGREGWKIVALLRFCPIPFGFANYAYGLTAISFWAYLLTTIVAIIPGNIFFVWVGASAQVGLDVILDRHRPRHPFEYAMLAIGLCAAFVAMGYITRIARAALQSLPEANAE